jgi:hypothetical protein
LRHDQLSRTAPVTTAAPGDDAGRFTSLLARPAARFVPVLVLASLIAFHGFQIVVHEDDPQRSGAFAMFATVDIGSTRRVLATVPGDEVTLEIPAELNELRAELMDRPSTESARELADLLLGERWQVRDGRAVTGDGALLGGVRVQVVGLDAQDRTIRTVVLADVTAEADG